MVPEQVAIFFFSAVLWVDSWSGKCMDMCGCGFTPQCTMEL